jgi:hypothetical protein
MPVQTTYPGVYVQELPSGARTIVGVSTSVTAFVGAARQGPANVPVRVRSVAEYVRTFGAPVGEAQPMGHSVSHFFANGGSDAIVVRVVGTPPSGDDRATVTLNNEAAAAVLVLRAIAPGTWANKVGGVGLEAHVDHATTNRDDLFNLVLRQRAQDPRSGASVVVVEESYRNLSMAPAHPRYAPKLLASSSLVAVTGPSPAPTTTAQGVSLGKVLAAGPVTLPPRPTLRVVVNYGAPVDLVLAPVSPSKSDVAAAITAAAANAGVPITATTAGERFTLTTTGTGGPNFAVTVEVAPSNDVSQVLGLGLTWSDPALSVANNVKETSGAATLRPAETGAMPKAFTGGRDFPATAAEIVPTSGSGGVYALGALEFPRFNLLCLPDLPAGDPTDTGDTTASVRNQALGVALSYCKRERAFLVVDTARTWQPKNSPNVGGIAALGEHGAIYYPRVSVVEPGPGGTPVELSLPASGAVAGVMARIDTSRGIWKAPAGLEAGIVGISGPAVPTDDALSGQLNPRGFNVLRTFPGAGTVIWGARTLKGADSQASEFKYVPVRRLTDYIASSLYLGTQFAVFEPNDPDLWGQLRLAVTTFMRGLYNAGAFQQSAKRAESDSFFVTCDETVNPQSEIDLGRVNVVVGFAPLKPAEFVVVTITQMTKLED